MKTNRSLSILLVSLVTVILPLSGNTEPGSRAAMNDALRAELLGLSGNEVPRGEIGDWKEALDSAAFMLFRRTELYRGRLHLLVLRSDSISLDLYPEGTLVVTTGLLDCIDERLFLKAEGSSRRIRDFDAEREAALVPFLALQASRFALDHNFRAWLRSGETPGGNPVVSPTVGNTLAARLSSSPSDTFESDRFAAVLLSMAGFKPDLLSSWLEEIAGESSKGLLNPALASWLSAFPAPEERLARMSGGQEAILTMTSAYGGILESLRTGTGLAETVASIPSLRERGHGSGYLDRLEALALHKLWLSRVSAETQILKTFFPFACDLDPERQSFVALARRARQIPGGIQSSSIPGDTDMYLRAIEAYRKTLDAIPDPGMVSSYARLLAHAGNSESRLNALTLAADAARVESGFTSRVARENYLALVFLTEPDPAKARALIQGMAENGVEYMEERVSDNVPEGFPGDSRDFEMNRILMTGLDKGKSATPNEQIPSGDAGEISFRKVRIGDSDDEVIAAWGKPAQITYNYYTETWDFPALGAAVTLARDTEGSLRVRLIKLGFPSPVSPGHDIRTGDKRGLLESVFGKPAWRSGDGHVYLAGRSRLNVLYLADRIRSITASSAD